MSKERIKSRVVLGFAVLMMTAGAISLLEMPTAASEGCCAPGNPYHCSAGQTCKEEQTCTILSGTCDE